MQHVAHRHSDVISHLNALIAETERALRAQVALAEGLNRKLMDVEGKLEAVRAALPVVLEASDAPGGILGLTCRWHGGAETVEYVSQRMDDALAKVAHALTQAEEGGR